MKRFIELVALLCLALGTVGCAVGGYGRASSPAEVIERASRRHLEPFGSERELRRFLRELARAREQQGLATRRAAGAKASCVPATCESLGCGTHPNGCGGSVHCGPCGTAKGMEFADEALAAPSAAAPAESITNVQHAGVDEGGIVKLRGDHLVVLRRGRLFTLDLASDGLKLVASVDAFGPDVDPSGTWYDEMLVSDDTIAVIGYSYERGGTEVGLFDIDPKGGLAHRATYHLRSNDYYSSRNYASRLIGNKLVFYSPLALTVSAGDPYGSLPAQRKWRNGGKARFTRIAHAPDVYRPLEATLSLAQHTVTVCNLASRRFDCRATVVLGPPARVFYVSPTSVYVWVGSSSEGGSIVYRMPLDGSAPTALRAGGSPTDQFSFLEEEAHLNVLVRSGASGDGMWASEVTSGDVALLRVALDTFSDGVARAPLSSYTRLPKPAGSTYQNRFVSNWVLYGTGNGWGAPKKAERGALYAHRFAHGGRAVRLPLAHGVDRIEVLGSDALVVGSDERDLHFSPIALGDRPWVAPRFARKGAAQGELRSHGFFYRSDGPRAGVLGLPVREAGSPGHQHLAFDSASVLFLENRSLSLKLLGTLASAERKNEDDGCRASCVDWYGNARPLFVQGRVFALLGYELVEGELRRGRITEKRRVSFAPRAAR